MGEKKLKGMELAWALEDTAREVYAPRVHWSLHEQRKALVQKLMGREAAEAWSRTEAMFEGQVPVVEESLKLKIALHLAADYAKECVNAHKAARWGCYVEMDSHKRAVERLDQLQWALTDEEADVVRAFFSERFTPDRRTRLML